MSKQAIEIKIAAKCPEGVDQVLFKALQKHFDVYKALPKKQFMEELSLCYLNKYIFPAVGDMTVGELAEAATNLDPITADMISCVIEDRGQAEELRQSLNKWARSEAKKFANDIKILESQDEFDQAAICYQFMVCSDVIARKSANA